MKELMKIFKSLFKNNQKENTNAKEAEFFFEQGNNEENPERAIAAYEMAIKLDPNLGVALINMGLIYADKMRDYIKAIDLYNQALQIDSDYSDAYFNMGCAYASMKDFNEAIRCFENTVKIDKYDFDAYRFMSRCYKDKGDEKMQLECVKRAAELGDRSAQSWLLEKGYIKVEKK